MAKIAYFGIPAHGHTNPTLPVVRELIKRGHEVLYYNAESFRGKVAATNVDYRAYPEPMPNEREVAEAMHELIDAALLLSRISERLTPFALAEMARERPDLILYDSTAMWGYITARTLGIRHITLFTHFVLEGSQGALGIREQLRYVLRAIPHLPKFMGWRRRMVGRYGKNVVGGITEKGDRSIVFTSQAFHPANRTLDESFRFTGASIDPAVRESAPSLELPAEGKVIYISLGTINHLNGDFYQAAFEAFADYDAQFVLSVGRNTPISSLKGVPANFTVRQFVPQLEVLRRADAFITHGGMNSVHEGLVNGVPLVVVPQQMEQLLNAVRVKETGTGVLIGGTFPYGQVSAAELRTALEAVLTDPAYRRRAVEIGTTLKEAGGYARAAAEIEGLISETGIMKGSRRKVA